MTKHLSYILEGMAMVALMVAIVIGLAVITAILLFPSFMFFELGISWSLWIYVVHFLVLSYLAGRYVNL